MWSTGAWACTYAHKVITVQNVPKSLCIHDCVHAFEWSYGYLMPTSGDIIIVTYEDHFLCGAVKVTSKKRGVFGHLLRLPRTLLEVMGCDPDDPAT